MPYQPFVDLLGDPLLEQLVSPVLGEDYLFHHANGKRITDGTGKHWHHDYDGSEPWDGRAETMMVHVMVYPAGLTADNGPLVLRPDTHRLRVPRHHPKAHGYEILDSDAIVVGPPGTVVAMNSATWHMRPPSQADGHRHYLNYSFIGPAPLARPEREQYAELLVELPETIRAGAQRDRVVRLCRHHSAEAHAGDLNGHAGHGAGRR